MEILACPVCGSDQLANGEDVYLRRYEQRTIDRTTMMVATVIPIRSNRCKGCKRLLIWESSGRPIDDDLLAARRGWVEPQEGQ